MLARVLKRDDATNFAPFAFPEIGGGESTLNTVTNFVVPSLDAMPLSTRREGLAATTPDDILQQAQDEAARIIAQAEENSSIIEQAAREKAAQAARAEFENEVEAKVSELRANLTQTIDQISGLSTEITAKAETSLVELALQIAKKIVGREVVIDREIALTLVKVSLGKLHDRSIAEVHLNPEDLVYVQAHREKLAFRGALSLVEDPRVTLGGCLIHTETGDIDARIESQFDEIAHGLLEM